MEPFSASCPFRPVTLGMAKKRTKSDKARRQADDLEKKLNRRPAQTPKKKATPSRSVPIS